MSDLDLLRSSRFRKEREDDWKSLERLVEKVERGGLASLSFQQADQLSSFYRQAMNSLSLAREISLDSALMDYLESLCARAYLAVYAPRDSLSGLATRFFKTSAPQAMRRSWPALLLAFLFLALGTLTGYLLTTSDPSWYYAFVGRELSGGRGPDATEEYLRGVIYNPKTIELDQLAAFSTSLFAHNTQVAIFSYTLGIIAGLPTGLLTFYNGTMLGAFFAIHDAKGLGLDLFGWLSIHGVTELGALIVAAAGGFRLGAAILFPGRNSRGYALRLAGRDAIKLAIIAALMLIVAGILEGVFRQTITDFYARVVIGWGIGLLWLCWFVLGGRGASGKATTGDR